MSRDPEMHPSLFDAYTPANIAQRIENVALVKAQMNGLSLLTLGILAGAFISFGAMFYTVVVTGSSLGFGLTKLIGGLSFCLGLILVVVGGAELFTGNVLIVMGWAHKKVTSAQLLRNWIIVYIGNFIGAVLMAFLVYQSSILLAADGEVAQTAIKIGAGKVSLGADELFVRGILCNALVCLAIWLCFAAHSVTDKILAILFPITAFVALGFEHSIANMYFIPLAMMQAGETVISNLDVAGLLRNLFFVTAGNIVGGGVFVALSYYFVYLRGRE
ncbi:putative formate transporter 1 (Formate channel 1) [Candidatus Terasakiella magnetica]|uniref:Putative formate transporter 1 (Formate channel 1) n=1 Tax=Candidatus Terasakiella magnetica TaxID=1867952 RepID=A0A1C3RFB5_9PROT|nr:formate/nitrite transporter family protein [Candidatus Terasakiella magnetica]SCA55986.1 putative formate transporter 1 (Formate channel 1) [Candidatus Terasakiella magnetica]